MDIHNRLKKLLKQKNWTRYRLSKECDLSESTITNIFKRGNTPTVGTLEIICKGMNITLSQFFAEGEMVEMTPELKELFDEWLYLTPQQKDAIIITMKAMKNNSNKE